MRLDLRGRRALVTGSTAGIGFAIAKELAGRGAVVVVNGRSQERIDGAIHRIKAAVPNSVVSGIAADVASGGGAAALIAGAPDIDILVNNFGIFEPKPFFAIEDSDWLRFFEANVMNGVRLARQTKRLSTALAGLLQVHRKWSSERASRCGRGSRFGSGHVIGALKQNAIHFQVNGPALASMSLASDIGKGMPAFDSATARDRPLTSFSGATAP